MITQHFQHLLILIVNSLCLQKSLIFKNVKINEIDVLCLRLITRYTRQNFWGKIKHLIWLFKKTNNNETLGEKKINHNFIIVIFFNHIIKHYIIITPKIHCMSKVLKGTLCAHDRDGTPSEKTLFAGLYSIWIISQIQQQQLCLILLHRTE